MPWQTGFVFSALCKLGGKLYLSGSSQGRAPLSDLPPRLARPLLDSLQPRETNSGQRSSAAVQQDSVEALTPVELKDAKPVELTDTLEEDGKCRLCGTPLDKAPWG